MGFKLKDFNISTLIDNLVIAFIYIIAALVTTLSVKDSSFPFYYALTTGLMSGLVIVKGTKSLLGFLIGTIIWQVITVITSLSSFQLSITNSLIFVISEGVTLFIISKALESIYDKKSLIEQSNRLVRFFLTSLLAPIPQAFAISYLLLNAGHADSSVTLFRLINLSWLSIAVSIISISPIFISFSSGINFKQNFSSIKFSWEIALFLFILITPNALEILNITEPPYSFPIQYLVFPTIFIVAFRKDSKMLSFCILVFYLITIYAASTSHGLFFSNNKFLNASNIYYFILFFLLMSLTLGVAVNEKRLAFESLKKSFSNAEEEVTRQIDIFKELNSKLFQEIEQKGIIEKELSESKDMIEESQTIANIASWQYDAKNNEISWSNSATKVLGIDSDRLPKTIEEYKRLIHPDDITLAEEVIKDAIKEPSNFEIELRHLPPGKRVNYFLIRGRSFEDKGKIIRVVGLLLDITKMKEIEKQLLEKEEKYRALFESNIDSVSVINPEDKTFVDVNQTFEKRYGYSRTEIIGKPYSLITAEVDETYSAIDHAFRNGSHRVQSRTHKRKNGEEFYAEGIFVKFMLAGKPLVFVISQDITKRKVAEKALAERELQYRLFFESDLIGMAEATPQKEWITFNNKLCTILGYKANELIQMTWDTLTHPEDYKMEMKFYNDLIVRKNSGYSIEKRFIRKDGTYIYCKVAVKAILNPNGNISHFVQLIEDISARKQIERELLDSRATLRRAQQIAKLGSWTWNPSKSYISINDEAYSLLGWKRSQSPFTIKNFIDTVAAEKREVVENLINDCIKEQKSMESIEIPIVLPNNELRYILLNLGYNFGSSVNISEVVATMADITDIKKAEIALKEANTLKDQIFSIIAHDLRGPIGSINQMIAFIANEHDSIDMETKRELLNSLKDTSQETFNLLENLLDWARSQRKVVYKPEKINLKNSADNAISLLQGLASPKNIAIENRIDNSAIAFADPYMLNTIFRNLLSNAIKFTPKNGEISIEAENGSDKVSIKFNDSGIGIPKKVLDKIFDDNNNYSTPGTNNEKGTGLGLKLVHKLISQNKGTIAVDSEQNIGTTFTVSLPIQ